ncbi:MAG: hypothetical protein V3R99_01755, partial [Thermoguttaceae bacterium]
FVNYFDVKPPTWEKMREVDFAAEEDFPASREDQASAILEYLDLEGGHLVPGKQNPNQLIVFRISGAGNYRITWNRRSSRIVVERQVPFSSYRLVNFLHFRCGYGQRTFAFTAWAVTVDLVAASLALWSVSGIYIWFRRYRKRFWGSACLLAGVLLFAVLVVLLCL